MILNLFFPPYAQGRVGLGLLLLRLVLGSAFVFHGFLKIQSPFNWMGAEAPVPGFLQALAALSEFGGGIAVILGLLTPLAALGLFFTMAFAVLMVHVPMGHPFVAMEDPTKPSYELALVYWIMSLNLLLNGPGTFSLDGFLFRGKFQHEKGHHPGTSQLS
jgi:putative oxidoreductase